MTGVPGDVGAEGKPVNFHTLIYFHLKQVNE